MFKKDLETLEGRLRRELVKREQLGGFDAHADTIIVILDALYKITQHLRERAREKKGE